MSGEASAPPKPPPPGYDCEYWAYTRGAIKGGLIGLACCVAVAFLCDAARDFTRLRRA